MSKFKTHSTVAILVYVAGLVCLGYFDVKASFEIKAASLLICLFAAWFPDIDTKSTAAAIFYTCFLCLDTYWIWQGHYREASILGLVTMLPVLLQHRGITHTLLAAFIFPFPLLFLSTAVYYWMAVAGYVSHLVLDRKLL